MSVVGAGSHTIGDFLSLSATSTDRYLDPPEFEALHDHGHSVSFFNRLDSHPSDVDTLFLNVQVGKSSFDVPNTYDTLAQSQHQDIATYNIAPGLLRVIGSRAVLSANAYRTARPPHLLTQSRPVRRHAGVGQPGSDADELRCQDGLQLSGRSSQYQGGRDDQRDEAARNVCVWHHRPDGSRVRRREWQLQSGVRAVRSYERRFALPLRSVAHDQAAGRVRAGPGECRPGDVQAGPPARPLLGTGGQHASRAAARRVLPRAAQRHPAARLVWPDDGDAVQREPAALGRLRVERALRCQPGGAGRQAQRGGNRRPAGLRQLDRRRLRVLQQTHRRTATTSASCSTRRSRFPWPGIIHASTASQAASI